MPRSVGPGRPRATAEPLDQVLMLMLMLMLIPVLLLMLLLQIVEINLDGTCGINRFLSRDQQILGCSLQSFSENR